MPRAIANVEQNDFSKGLLTEVSPFTFPPNSSVSEENMYLLSDGTRRRRLGADYEPSHSARGVDGLSVANLETAAMTTHKWRNVGGASATNFLVVQLANKLWFFDFTTDPISATPKNSGNAITLSGVDITTPIQADQIAGEFVVAAGLDNVFVLSYDSGSDTVSQVSKRLDVRDHFGIDDGLAVDDRPATLSNNHKYNLLNQGWTETDITTFDTSQSVFPSNADIVYLGKDTSDVFDPTLLIKQFFGTSPAAKGKFVIDAFDRGDDRETAAGMAGLLATDSTVGGITSVAFYAGRAFYAGEATGITGGDDNSPNFSNMIFFSQVATTIDKAFLCHAEADPTSEHVSDLVDSDGGFIPITDATRLLKILPIGLALLVIAENGVWQVSGGEVGFSATDFLVTRVADVDIDNPESFVITDEGVFFWGTAGIFQMTPDPITGNLITQILSDETIQSFFADIPVEARRFVQGVYDSVAREVHWLYNDDITFLAT